MERSLWSDTTQGTKRCPDCKALEEEADRKYWAALNEEWKNFDIPLNFKGFRRVSAKCAPVYYRNLVCCRKHEAAGATVNLSGVLWRGEEEVDDA